jgi:hypothetical protein
VEKELGNAIDNSEPGGFDKEKLTMPREDGSEIASIRSVGEAESPVQEVLDEKKDVETALEQVPSQRPLRSVFSM